jgi:hypothetical protein
MTTILVVGTNTYISLADAETYFTDRLNITTWSAATDANKNKALLMACKIIDDQRYMGQPFNYLQSMAFPRYGLKTRQNQPIPTLATPDDVKWAQCEQALFILDQSGNEDATSERRQLIREGVIEMRIGDYSETYKDNKSGAVSYSLCPMAKERLLPYLQVAFNGFSQGSYF